MSRVILLSFAFLLFHFVDVSAQPLHGEKVVFTHADTVRGSITPERAWWNVLRYDIAVTPDYNSQTISGSNTILIKILKEGKKLQLDLQEPMIIDAIHLLTGGKRSGLDLAGAKKKKLSFTRAGNAWYVSMPSLKTGSDALLEVTFHGKPRAAVRPPWDGGWIWTKDAQGRPWMSVACQGLGASVWYPCKDHQSDEPDSGAILRMTVPDTLVAVGNGRAVSQNAAGAGKKTYVWQVVDPINNYDIIPYIGKYEHWHKDYAGEKGKLDCDYWVLDYNLEKAKAQFMQADTMLHCFEYWMGPYPFYEDSYKLVEAPHLGMEHQSAVAYGNHFGNGYLGRDLSGTGWGLKWDFIVVHESGHEWFGNNITSNDLADMWIHESFTNYSETLYTTCQYGVEAGNDYVIGTRKNIRNDKPIIGYYNVNYEGSGDMYYKGGNMIHMIRQIVGDSAFRGMLRGLQKTFYHSTVSTQQIESFISEYAKKDLSGIFTQYLRTTKIPVLEYKANSHTLLSYRWTNCVKGFAMPIKVSVAGQPEQWITPTEDWKTLNIPPAALIADSAAMAKANSDSASRTGTVVDSTVKAVDSSAVKNAAVNTGATNTIADDAENLLKVNRNFYITVKKIS